MPAGAGLTGMLLAEALSNRVGKQLVQRLRPPEEWIPGEEVRPDSSSFPSGHTAAGVAPTDIATGAVVGLCAAVLTCTARRRQLIRHRR
jgi:undecaprenyl-diphosphatase